MQLSELIETSGDFAGLSIMGLSADSRDIQPGWLFAALPGVAVDGADFIEDAIKKGAVAVLAKTGTTLPADVENVALVTEDNPRQGFANMAARFYADQPATLAAVTGTNGKTSTVHFTRQLWEHLGHKAASLGTLGICAPGREKSGALTTPDPVTLHAEISALSGQGVTHLALEASSHGLSQYRLDGLRLTTAAFTNLSRDHLDYHGTMDDYHAAKARLFSDILLSDGTAVLNADTPEYALLESVCADRGIRVLSFGEKGKDICLHSRKPTTAGQDIVMSIGNQKNVDIKLSLVGAFQVSNILCAAGLVLAAAPDDAVLQKNILAALSELSGVRGRLEHVASHPNGAAVYVDYAHTPDALENVLQALRPHVTGRLHVVFGCGGDRDRGKRPEMGKIAIDLADIAVVTDDNPRTEDAAFIRSEIMAACPDAQEIGDRATAIHQAIAALQPGDILVVAGKGHEQGQLVGDQVIPFDDASVARAAVQEVAA